MCTLRFFYCQFKKQYRLGLRQLSFTPRSKHIHPSLAPNAQSIVHHHTQGFRADLQLSEVVQLCCVVRCEFSVPLLQLLNFYTSKTAFNINASHNTVIKISSCCALSHKNSPNRRYKKAGKQIKVARGIFVSLDWIQFSAQHARTGMEC